MTNDEARLLQKESYVIHIPSGHLCYIDSVYQHGLDVAVRMYDCFLGEYKRALSHLIRLPTNQEIESGGSWEKKGKQ